MKARAGLAGLLLALAPAALAAPKCVRIYYDRVPSDPTYRFGRTHALFLQNLLGHFPDVQQIVAPIETYRHGDLDTCAASLYLGTYYDNPGLPKAFVEDYATTTHNVLWAGYNVWSLSPRTLKDLWRVKFRSLSVLDSLHLDDKGQPTFFRFFDYKGETWEKYGEFDRSGSGRFLAAWEISTFDYDPAEVSPYVVAWARHSGTGERQPYILRNGNRWYVGDSPFSFMDEEDRYLIFSDVLFDVLDEAPRYASGPKPALLRLEDVHPLVPHWQLETMRSLLERKGIHYSIAMIPVFTDPFGVAVDRPEDKFVAITSRPLFVDWAKQAEQGGASFIFHGFTHQYGAQRNPFDGLTGDDFEFWDRVANRPVARDSADWALGRLEDGLDLLERAGVRPVAWMTPHYQASGLDYRLFGQIFSWNVGRVIYFPDQRLASAKLPAESRMDVAGTAGKARRKALAATVEAGPQPDGLPSGQFYPYEIYGDAYDQRVVPEDVGNVQPYMNEQVFAVQTVDDLIRVMHRNRVLRDCWASLFVHPFRLEAQWQDGIGRFAGDTAGVERLLDEARADGYEFVDLKAWTAAHRDTLRPPPQEIFITPEPQAPEATP